MLEGVLCFAELLDGRLDFFGRCPHSRKRLLEGLGLSKHFSGSHCLALLEHLHTTDLLLFGDLLNLLQSGKNNIKLLLQLCLLLIVGCLLLLPELAPLLISNILPGNAYKDLQPLEILHLHFWLFRVLAAESIQDGLQRFLSEINLLHILRILLDLRFCEEAILVLVELGHDAPCLIVGFSGRRSLDGARLRGLQLSDTLIHGGPSHGISLCEID
mmetsp:Transcript_74662/g.177700  ORF Transcript_74662/g.177700 Transcript_74662/m.177700 type:complete len:215 (-) Transcript_74662:1411-2055(-)